MYPKPGTLANSRGLTELIAITRTALGFIVVCSIGCARNSEGVDPPDATGSVFCVPAEYEIPDLVSIPESPLYTNNGVAFKGCFRNTRVALEDCVFPRDMINGGVGPPREGVSWLWDQMPWNAHYRQLLSDPLTTVEEIDRDLVRLDNPEDWRWYVWKKERKEAVTTAKNETPDVEELMAVCRETPSGPACRRLVQTESFLLRYSFLNNTTFSVKSLRGFDDAVIGIVEGWRCAESGE